MGHDDPFLMALRFAPILFVVGGVLMVVWLSRQRLPYELEPDVLAALSETEALSLDSIRLRPPLAHQEVDVRLLVQVLDRLCCAGLAVRWYEDIGAVSASDGRRAAERRAVYRRVMTPPAITPSP